MSEIFVDRVQELNELLEFIRIAIHVHAPYIGVKGVVGLPGCGKTSLLKSLYSRVQAMPSTVAIFIDNYSPKLLEEIYEGISTKRKLWYKLMRFIRSSIGSRYTISLLVDVVGELVPMGSIPMKPIEILLENAIKSSELVKEINERYSLALKIIESLDPQSVLVIIADDFGNIHLLNLIEIFFLLPLAAIEKKRKICIITAVRSSQIDEFLKLGRNYSNKLLLFSKILKTKPPIIHAINFDDPLFLRELSISDCVELVKKVTEIEGASLSLNEAQEICRYSKGHPLITLLSIRKHRLAKLRSKGTWMSMALEYLTDRDVIKFVLGDVCEILNELSREGKRDELLFLYILATSGGNMDITTLHRLLSLLSPRTFPTLLLDERIRQLVTVEEGIVQFVHPMIHGAILAHFFKHERPLIPKEALIQMLSYIRQQHRENAIVFALLHKDVLGSYWFEELIDMVNKSSSLIHALSVLENIYSIYEGLVSARLLSVGPDYCSLVYEYSKHKLAHGAYLELLNTLDSSIEKCRMFPELYALLCSCYAYAVALYGDFEKSVSYSDVVIESIKGIDARKWNKDIVIAYSRACFSKALAMHALGNYMEAAKWYREAAKALMRIGIPMGSVYVDQLGISLLVPHPDVYARIINDRDLLWLCARIHLQVAHLLSLFDRNKSLEIEEGLYRALSSLAQRYSNNVVLQELIISTMHRLAGSLESIGRKDEALELEDRAMRLADEYGMLSLYGLTALGKAGKLIDRGKYDEALQLLESACTTLRMIEYFGEYVKCLLCKAYLLYLLKRFREACSILESPELHHLLQMTKYVSAYRMYHKLKAEILDKVCKGVSS